MLRRRLAKRKRENAEPDAAPWEEDAAAAVDDTLASVQLLTIRNAQAFARIGVAPFVLWHQLYAVFPNRTFVDQNVSRLRDSGALVTFRVSPGTSDVAVLPVTGYTTEVDKWLASLRLQESERSNDPKIEALSAFRDAVPALGRLPTISMEALIGALSGRRGYARQATDADDGVRLRIRLIQQLGFLLPTARLDDETFHLHMPGVGKVAAALKKTRTTVVGALKRTRYKEIQEQQLKKLKLKHSPFAVEFHLADMEGHDLIRRTEVTSGTLVSLREE